MSWFRPARGCNCDGSRMKSEVEGFWMVVVASKGVGADGDAEKLSCGSCGDSVAVAVDFLPVNTSQL